MIPILRHSLTGYDSGVDSLEEGIDCMTLLLFHGYKNRPISSALWELYPHLLDVWGAGDNEEMQGYQYEQIYQCGVAIKNYISRDPGGMVEMTNVNQKSNL